MHRELCWDYLDSCCMIASCLHVIAEVELAMTACCLCDQEGKKFRVVVMDSRPQLEGRALLRRLLSHGIACSYVLLNSASYIMQEVTKVQ